MKPLSGKGVHNMSLPWYNYRKFHSSFGNDFSKFYLWSKFVKRKERNTKGLRSLYLFLHRSTQRVQQIKMLEFANISNGCCEPPSFHESKQPDGSNQLC